eukprot:TRINITY_DN14_c0_g1_i1.p1 TRINITY_DN14_c0_g1~~TRINITY_DN14_c0_g1_i1.p1  ORF type:complete len:998 (-),score=166.39 TRINITY_DN14_c0_g1_i1:338-3331(-)
MSEIDEGLYNRQLYVLGQDTMKKMMATRVLIVGLSGLGCEIAKNLILTGIQALGIHDETNVQWHDLSALFYATESDVGSPKYVTCCPKLQELNKNCRIERVNVLDESSLEQFQVVIFVDQLTTLPAITILAEHCHKKNIKVVATESRGLAGFVFCDFGPDFYVHDTDGEEPITCLITSVTNTNPVAITVHDESRHGLEDGQRVFITDIEGPTELNNKEWEVTVTGPFTFTINFDATTSPGYVRGGYVKPVKKTLTLQFKSLANSIKEPALIESDFGKLGRPLLLHLLFQALHQFHKIHQFFPHPFDKAEAEEVLALVQQLKTAQNLGCEIDCEVITDLSMSSTGNLNPLAALLGGMVAQEALKACSGKFSPLQQWLYFDAHECLPDPLPTPEDAQPRNCRYDGQIAVFGQGFQGKLLHTNNFLVGAGALGCEFLKNFALMGIGCGAGQVIVTDMDTIEKSNLSRQFLFRSQHIGQLKSDCAAAAARTINPQMNVRALADKVAPETEHIFNDKFWDNINGVTNALDNIQARLYVDSKCVYYRKPLLESGTLGTKGNIQVVVPFITESYGSSRDPPEKQIPICTLKNFPNAIEHCIQWARDAFEGLFKQSAEDATAYLTQPAFLQQLEKEPGTRLATLEGIFDMLVKSKPHNFGDCVAWARTKFEEYFHNNIRQLLFNFPVDTITNSGEPFWSGPKRPPSPLHFDPSDPTHTSFVISAALLRAEIYGIRQEGDDDWIIRHAAAVQVPDFQPRKSNIQVEEGQKVDDETSRDPVELQKQLPAPASLGNFVLKAIEFEKDNDENHHIDFITACSNLRARNYKIPEADRAKTKQIAGKIIPAMVTTTAMVTGLVCLEWYKVLQSKPIAAYKNSFLNLATPFLACSEPLPPAKATYGDKEWTLWDRFDIDEGRDVSLKEFISIFENKFQLGITMISSGSSIIFSSFAPKAKIAERMPKPLSQVVQEVSKVQLPASTSYINMEICCTLDDDDVDVPYVRYKFRH